MKEIRDVGELRASVAELRGGSQGAGARTIGFVPTMGCLHEGHLALMRAAREACDHVVVSIFVNPTQFGPGEDFDSYPRQLEADAAKCREVGVDVLYTPDDASMYPEGFTTFVREELLSIPLCGQGRAGHFRGVTTVVTKLFHRVLPDVAFFGQKDAQQALVLRRMVRDLDFPVEVRIEPTVREADGLALSSRNRYLSDEERGRALALSRALGAIREGFEAGERRADSLLAAGKKVLGDAEGVELEYLELVDVRNLAPVPSVEGKVLVAVAARVGAARLIDNIVLDGAAGAAGVPL